MPIAAAKPRPTRFYSTAGVVALIIGFGVLTWFKFWQPREELAFVERMGINVGNLPLSAYRDKSFYTMRTDALYRFGTKLEQRFSRRQIEEMMLAVGLADIQFSEDPPYWCVVGYKAN